MSEPHCRDCGSTDLHEGPNDPPPWCCCNACGSANVTDGRDDMTLTEFLLARIAEDEALANEARHECLCADDAGHWEMVGYEYEGEAPREPGTIASSTTAYDPEFPWTNLVNRYDPARVLAECEAKRRIIRRHSRTTADHWSGAGNCEGCGFEGDMDLAVTPDYEICPELADLASVYADHPDFREEWRV